jgi:hypothetical protein
MLLSLADCEQNHFANGMRHVTADLGRHRYLPIASSYRTQPSNIVSHINGDARAIRLFALEPPCLRLGRGSTRHLRAGSVN